MADADAVASGPTRASERRDDATYSLLSVILTERGMSFIGASVAGASVVVGFAAVATSAPVASGAGPPHVPHALAHFSAIFLVQTPSCSLIFLWQFASLHVLAHAVGGLPIGLSGLGPYPLEHVLPCAAHTSLHDCCADSAQKHFVGLFVVVGLAVVVTGGGMVMVADSRGGVAGLPVVVAGATVVDGGGLGPQNWSSMLSTSVSHGLSPKKNAWAFPPVTGLASAPSTELQMPLSSPPLASLALSSTSAFIRYPVGMCSSS